MTQEPSVMPSRSPAHRRMYCRPIYGRDITTGMVLEPDKYASRSPYDRSDYGGDYYFSPRWPQITGWLVTGIEHVTNKDGRKAVMLGLEWGVMALQPDHTNAMTWAWEDEALHNVLCREDGTPLTECEAYDLAEEVAS